MTKPTQPTITNYQPVDSSNITEVGYDAPSQTLGVKFRSGSEYHYPDVSPEEHQAFISADSVGRFHAQKFKGRQFVRIGEPEDRQ
jgi:hypothetical protein